MGSVEVGNQSKDWIEKRDSEEVGNQSKDCVEYVVLKKCVIKVKNGSNSGF